MLEKYKENLWSILLRLCQELKFSEFKHLKYVKKTYGTNIFSFRKLWTVSGITLIDCLIFTFRLSMM